MRKSMHVVLYLVFFAFISVVVSTTGYATDGMNMEGYGPIATGMGGASMAYDNGNAAMMNNPATLGLMPEGNRLDVALGYLGPNIKATCEAGPCAGQSVTSSSNAFYMPAFGWVRKAGQLSYGVGVFSQGGMGAEYAADSFMAAGSSQKVRSELGVGRVLIPIAYSITPDLSIGGSIDYVWASLDLMMAAPLQQLGAMVTSSSGPLMGNLGGLPGTNWARIDFSGGGDFSGAAKGFGLAAKLGATYKINTDISVGAVYQSKTSLSDLKTSGEGAALSAQGGGSVPGKITVRNFQWPETYAVGVAWNATKDLMVAIDIKQINWKSVMKDFKMTFEGAGSTIDFALPQNWKDQTVFEIGGAYKVSPDWTLRAGLNIANNPIPDTYLNALFPAIEKNHVTLGAGYMVSKASSVDASFTYAPEVKGGEGITTAHSQTNVQVMYSYRF